VNEEREVKATRKPHRCEWCPEKIEVGQRAIKRAYIWEGEFHHGYLHPECWDALCRSDFTEDGFTTGEQKRGQAYDYYGDPIPTELRPRSQATA